MAADRVGAIDDPIWSMTGDQFAQRTLSLAAIASSALALFIVPLVCFLVRGLDWEAVLYAVSVVLLLLTLVQRRWVVPVLTSLVLALVLLMAVEGVNAGKYHTLRLDGPPSRLRWCGRDYDKGSVASTSSTLGSVLLTSHRTQALVTPSGTAIYAHAVCNPKVGLTFLFAPTSGGALVYYLQGGP